MNDFITQAASVRKHSTIWHTPGRFFSRCIGISACFPAGRGLTGRFQPARERGLKSPEGRGPGCAS